MLFKVRSGYMQHVDFKIHPMKNAYLKNASSLHSQGKKKNNRIPIGFENFCK